MGVHSRGGVIIATWVRLGRSAHAAVGRLSVAWSLGAPPQGKGNHGDGVVLHMEPGEAASEARAVCRGKWVEGIGDPQASLRRAKVDPDEYGCSAEEPQLQAGFRVWGFRKESVVRVEGTNAVARIGLSGSEVAPGSMVEMNSEQRTGYSCQEKGRERETDRSRRDALNSEGYGNVEQEHDLQNSPEHCFQNGDDSIGDVYVLGAVWPDGLLQSGRNGPRRTFEEEVGSVDASKPKTRNEVLQDRKPVKSMTDEVCQASQGFDRREGNVNEIATTLRRISGDVRREPLVNRSESSGEADKISQFPVPLSPLSGEVAKSIEYERAMVAESAMKSGPAMSRSGVLFEDEWLLVLNKPCGIYSEHVLASVPSLVTFTARESFLSHLDLRRPIHNKDSSGLHLHMANRLDRDTSGVMVITKCRKAAGRLSNMFTKRQVQKSYVALCSGLQPSWRMSTVESGHGRSRFGAWRVYSKKDVGSKLPGGSVVRDMTTRLVVIAINKRIGPANEVDRILVDEQVEIDTHLIAGDETSTGILQTNPCDSIGTSSKESSGKGILPNESVEVVVRAFPLTGRTHQIRLHCQFVGLPLRGDVKYGGSHIQCGVRYDHHALHAESLSFKHPFTFEDLHFTAPLPQWAIDAGVQPFAL